VSITAASVAALALLDTNDGSMPIHSTYSSGVNLRCGGRLVHAGTRADGGVSSLCMTAQDVVALRSRPSWVWADGSLVGLGGRPVITMDDGCDRYPTSPPRSLALSPTAPDRLLQARTRAGLPSWFDTGVGRALGLPRMRKAIGALVEGEPDAAEQFTAVVGLGAGLTPSADDALVGALCLLTAAGTIDAALRGQIARWFRADGAAATTDVSMSYLRFAVDGAFSSPVIRVVESLTQAGSPADLDESVRVLGELGQTSGMDTVLGVQLVVGALTTMRR
jgi:hypothetical protein